MLIFFFISSSFGRQLSEKYRWAGMELNVRTHITEPPCSYLVQKGKSLNLKTR